MAYPAPVRITHVIPDDPLIKVYGICDDSQFNIIEKVLDLQNDRLQQGEGTIRSPSDAAQGNMVLVPRFHKYRRAEILKHEDGGKKVLVQFVDIGGTALYNLFDLRLLSAIPQYNLAAQPVVPPLEYILCGALKLCEWTPDKLELVNAICKVTGRLLECNVSDVFENYTLLNINYITQGNFATYANFLVRGNHATSATPEQVKEVIRTKYELSSPLNQQFQAPPSVPPGLSLNNYNIPATLPNNFYSQPQPPVLPSPVNYAPYVIRPNLPPPIHPFSRLHGPRPIFQMPKTEPIPQNFTSETLPVGSQYDIYVSHVMGMQNFTIQLKSSVDNILRSLMVAINDKPAEPFTDPLQPGTVCLGRYAADNALCRAVVSTVMAEGANLYFVDFGNTEIVQFNEIYRIRPEFMREKMVAIRFSLASCADDYLLSSKDAQNVFTDLVTNTCADNLVMKVTKPETPLKQFCELFIKVDGKLINIKNKVSDKMRMLQPASFQSFPFKKNSQADVVVSFVESPARFFIQATLNEIALDNIMKDVERYCATSENKEVLYVEDVNESMAVCAKYKEDETWYRALVINEADTNTGEVEVLFVDYGNQDLVHFSNLRIMTNEMVQNAPMQAVECRLDFDADLSLRDDVVATFTQLVEDKEFAMHVTNVLPAKVLLVDLVDKATNQNIKDLLAQKFLRPPISPAVDSRPIRRDSRPTSGSQVAGNWRERQNSTSGDGDFTAFKNHKPEARNNYAATDETDNMNKVDAWEKKDRFSPRDSTPKRPNRNDDEQSDTWSKKPSRQEDSWNKSDTNRWSQHDDRTNADNDGGGFKPRGGRDENSWPPNRDNDGFRPRGRENDRDGGRSFNRDDRWGNKGGDSWNSNRGGDDEGRKPYQKQDSWNTKNDDSESKNDTWNSKKKDDDWSGNRRGGDRDFKSNDNWGDNRRGGERDFKSNDNWGNRDSKPSFGNRDDRGENRFREKRDFGGSWKNDSDTGGWNNDRGSRRDDNKSGGWRNDSSSNSWGAPKTPSLEPAYDRGAKFVEPDYQAGQEMQVIITWFVNPDQFFVMPVENSEFRTMMDSFQSDYSRRQPIDLNTLKPSENVVARDKDDVIYRARFLRGRPGGAVVCFVDYGNTTTVKKDGMWAVSQEHCKIPVQAFCCKLHDISPVDENTSWAQVEGVDKYFEGDNYTLTFVDSMDEAGFRTWTVQLVNADGVNVGDLLVKDGLAVRKNVLKSEELYEFGLLKNQVLAAFPGAIVSSKKFFLHVEPETAQIISGKIKELVEIPENLVPLPPEQIVEGKFCLTCSEDNEYYRALILGVESATEMASIVYIDYGDENEVAFNQITELPDYLCVYNAQIAECCLYGGEKFEFEETFSETIDGNDIMIKVVDVIDDKLHVILYDIQGNRLPFPDAVDETVSPLCALPVLKSNEKVIITHIDKEKVYYQRVVDDHYITGIADRLFEVYDNQEIEKVALEVDKIYVAKSGKFETWYRCKAVDAECKEVFYLDYGNTESVDELLSLKPLDEEFFASFMFCKGVSTSVHFTAEDLTPLIDGVQNVTFDATFKSVGSGEWHVDFVCQSTFKTLSDFAVEFGCGEPIPSSEEEPPAYSVFSDWNVGEEKAVKISNVDSPDCVYLQSVEDEPKLVTIQDKLRTSLKRILPLYGPLDEFIAAQKASDKEWYRAEPLSADEVFAIDFGFTFKPHAVKKLPDSFKLDKSNYIISCALNIQPSEGEVWSEKVISRLTDIGKNATHATAKLEFVKHYVKYIDIKADDKSVGAGFVDDNIATYKAHNVVISHSNSIKDFYLQFSEDLEEIYSLLDKLKEADTWESIEPEADKVFAAQFVDDEQWYRAVVVNTQEDESKLVRFIDYGNEGLSTQFRALPEDLQKLSPYAIKCCQYPEPDDADVLSELFVEYIESAEGYFSAYVISGGEPMMVMLLHNEKHIDQILADKKMLLEWKLEPAKIGEKVVISHINSPSSFYVRNESVTLEEVEAALAELDNAEPLTEFAVDDIVAAKFPEDDLWYRAKIISIVEGIPTVLFFDYGNTSEVSELRLLPDGAKLTPCSAKHCSFPVPSEQGEWPDVASARFAELNCSGDTVFDITIKEDGDLAVVDLYDHGNSVAEELATICKADLTAPSRESSKEIVILSHVASLNAVWIQSQSPQLDEMINEMANAETFDELESASVGMLVAAQFEEEWYRASVLEPLESGYKVLFIDYGNESDISLIKSLPEDLATLTPLAKCCQLKNVPADIETSIPDILDKLQELVDQATTLYVDELEDSNGLNVVSLSRCDDGKVLSQFLLGVDENVGEEIPLASDSLAPEKSEDSNNEGVLEKTVEESVNEDDTTLEVTTGDAITESVNEDDVTFIEPVTNVIATPVTDESVPNEIVEDLGFVDNEKSEDAEAAVEYNGETESCANISTKEENDVKFENLNGSENNLVENAELEKLTTSTADSVAVLITKTEELSVTHTLSSAENNVEAHIASTELPPLTCEQKDIELNSTKNGCDETLPEEDNDADFSTPPSKSVENEIYATPEGLLDVSSASEEFETSYSYSSAPQILDSPGYAELFLPSDEMVAFENHEFQVSHISSVNSFYVQKYDDSKRIDLISKLLKAIVEGDKSTALVNPVVGNLAAAKFNGTWFRVKILEISNSNLSSLLCIDHGNVCSSEELYALPEKIVALPALAYHCALYFPDQSKQVDLVNEKFVELVHAQNLKLKVELKQEKNDVYVIDLFNGNESVSAKLLHVPESVQHNEPEEKNEEFGTNDQESPDAFDHLPDSEKKVDEEIEVKKAPTIPTSEILSSEPNCYPEVEFNIEKEQLIETSTELEKDEAAKLEEVVNEESTCPLDHHPDSEIEIKEESEVEKAPTIPVSEILSSEPDCSSEVEANVEKEQSIETSTELDKDEKAKSKEVVNEELACAPGRLPDSEIKIEAIPEEKIQIETVPEKLSSAPYSSPEIESNAEKQTELTETSLEITGEKAKPEEISREESTSPLDTFPDSKMEVEEIREAKTIQTVPVSEIESNTEKEKASIEISTETCSTKLEKVDDEKSTQELACFPDAKIEIKENLEKDDGQISEKSSSVLQEKSVIKEQESEEESKEKVIEVPTPVPDCCPEVEKATEQQTESACEKLSRSPIENSQVSTEKVSETSASPLTEVEKEGEPNEKQIETPTEKLAHLPSQPSEMKIEDVEERKLDEEQIEKIPNESSRSLSPSEEVETKVVEEEKSNDTQTVTTSEKLPLSTACSSELKTKDVKSQKSFEEQAEKEPRVSSPEVSSSGLNHEVESKSDSKEKPTGVNSEADKSEQLVENSIQKLEN